MQNDIIIINFFNYQFSCDLFALLSNALLILLLLLGGACRTSTMGRADQTTENIMQKTLINIIIHYHYIIITKTK